MASQTSSEPVPGIKHGRVHSYNKYKCRCKPCRAAVKDKSQRHRDKKRLAVTGDKTGLMWTTDELLVAIDPALSLKIAERAVALGRRPSAVRLIRHAISQNEASVMARLVGHEDTVAAFRQSIVQPRAEVPWAKAQRAITAPLATRRREPWTTEDILFAMSDDRSLTEIALALKRTMSAINNLRYEIRKGQPRIMARLVDHQKAVAAFRQEQ